MLNSGNKTYNANKLFLYNNGDQCDVITGGWAFTKPNSIAGNYSSSFNKDGCLFCGGQNTGTGAFETVNVIDMEQYDRLMVEFYYDGTASSGNCNFRIAMNNQIVLTLDATSVLKLQLAYAEHSELINGKVKLSIGTANYSTTYLYIKRVWLEKGQ